MLIRITKNTNKQHVIKYIRDNGTETWMQTDDFFIRHDLSHYALEKIMGYKTAFNGMLNAGMDISDFADKEKRASITVTDEAWYAENMANLFLIEIVQGKFEDFNSVQQSAFVSFNQQYPVLTIAEEKITAIRNYLGTLLLQWNEMQDGETLELTFDL
ncbi:MAG: hypothetical protein ABIS69_02180 [Sediminibacterium sp.]